VTPEQGAAAPAASGDGTPLYFTPGEAAAIVRVCPKTLIRWAAKDASLPVLRIAGVTRYPRERLLRWLASREQGGQRTRSPLHPARNPASGKATA